MVTSAPVVEISHHHLSRNHMVIKLYQRMQEGCGTVKRWPPEGCVLEDMVVVGHHPVPC